MTELRLSEICTPAEYEQCSPVLHIFDTLESFQECNFQVITKRTKILSVPIPLKIFGCTGAGYYLSQPRFCSKKPVSEGFGLSCNTRQKCSEYDGCDSFESVLWYRDIEKGKLGKVRIRKITTHKN